MLPPRYIVTPLYSHQQHKSSSIPHLSVDTAFESSNVIAKEAKYNGGKAKYFIPTDHLQLLGWQPITVILPASSEEASSAIFLAGFTLIFAQI